MFSDIKIGDKVIICKGRYPNNDYSVGVVNKVTTKTFSLEDRKSSYNKSNGVIWGGNSSWCRTHAIRYTDELWERYNEQMQNRVMRREALTNIYGFTKTLETQSTENLCKVAEIIKSLN